MCGLQFVASKRKEFYLKSLKKFRKLTKKVKDFQDTSVSYGVFL